LGPCRLGASIRVNDSVIEGRSRFFAEISRLSAVVKAAGGDPPVLFLLDELLSGTNSHDRQQGAEGLLRGLLERGAFGITTTHDLALIEIARALPQAANFHFEDSYRDGAIHFDYRLRPGPVERGNAIALMRSIGLDV
jgi:DNA mismatch repair ATPase MutS